MKDITNELRIGMNEEINKGLMNFPDEKLTIGGIEMPKSIISAATNFGKKYEAEGVRDIKDNYYKLTRCYALPLHLLNWNVNLGIKLYKKYGNLPDMEERDLYPLNIKKFPPSLSSNMCNLDSVRITNIKHIPNKNYFRKLKFKAIEFDIHDRFNDSIPAVFIYEDSFTSLLPAVHKEMQRKQVEQVLNSMPLDTFNIGFFALDEKVKGKMLKAESITKNKLDDKEIAEEPVESDEISDLEKTLTRVPALSLIGA